MKAVLEDGDWEAELLAFVEDDVDAVALIVSLESDEYILISSSWRGKDQKMIWRWTGSGMCSYLCSMD